jgi:putative ABC transport system permease protein
MKHRRSAWRVAGRLSRREVRRRPGRAALVALLVAAPVATMTVAAVMVRSNRLTPIQEWRFNGGRADAVLQGDAGSLLPAGSRAVAFRSDYPLVRTAEGRRVRAEVTDLPLDDPLADGIFGLVAGRVPHTAAEVALSRHTARRQPAR